MVTPLVSAGKGRHSGKHHRLVASVASEAMGIGTCSEVLTVLGGKASCRRKFVLNVHLVDEHGNLVSRDLAIIASVAYAHDLTPVVRDEKPFLAESPLFTTFNGVEFPAQDRPTRMISGRASFKLAISLLSSKCDNRLFCVCFTPQAPAGEITSTCMSCYSKPIRSISRKRTQNPSHVSVATPPIFLAGLESTGVSQNSSIRIPVAVQNGSRGRLEVARSASPGCSSENDANCVASAGECQLQSSSRSSSVKGILHLSPSSVRGASDGNRSKEGRAGCTSELVLQESLSPDGSGGGIGSLTMGTGAERLGETDVSGSSTGTMVSAACSLSPANTAANCSSIPCSLSLRLSPSDSGSPTSGPLTPESSFDNKDSTSLAHNQAAPLAGCSDNPSVPACVTFGTSRPFRPYASVGRCMVSSSDFQLGNSLSLPSARSHQSFMGRSSSSASSGDGAPEPTLGLLEVLRSSDCAASPAQIAVAAGKEDFSLGSCGILHNFSLGSCRIEEKSDSSRKELSLEEEEKSLQYIEVTLQEVNREVQRRKEELRSKRRRLLEDEARMHSIIFQSSSWIQSLSGRLS